MRTFIVRLAQDAGGSDGRDVATGRLRGVVDEVSTGLRATFRNEQELVAALLASVSDGPPGPQWDERFADEPSSGARELGGN